MIWIDSAAQMIPNTDTTNDTFSQTFGVMVVLKECHIHSEIITDYFSDLEERQVLKQHHSQTNSV